MSFDKSEKKSGAVITRFAPSPTGLLHLGHALAADRAFGFAREAGGTCLLRIEDIDTTRCKPEFTAAIYEDLGRLGFDWPEPVHVQSAHFEDYARVLEGLKSRGLVYPCYLTRRELAQFPTPYVNPGPLKTPQEACGKTPAWRLSMRAARNALGAGFDSLTYTDNGDIKPANAERYGDVVLARKDIGTSYHLACTHDDALQGTTDVVRGSDLADMTGLHRVIQALMGWPTPDYHHHGLVMKDDTDKLSKRSGDTAISQLLTDGFAPAEILEMARAGAVD